MAQGMMLSKKLKAFHVSVYTGLYDHSAELAEVASVAIRIIIPRINNE